MVKNNRKNSYSPRNQNPQIIICTEGELTEPEYIKSLVSNKYQNIKKFIKYKHESNKVSGINLIKPAKKLTNNLDFFCYIMDIDNDDNNDKKGEKIRNSVSSFKENDNNILLISNRSIEYWALLHFEYSTAPFTKGDDICSKLVKHGVLNHTKHKEFKYEIMLNKHEIAIKNAKTRFKEIEKIDKANDTKHKKLFYNNPSTNMYELLERLDDISSKIEKGKT